MKYLTGILLGVGVLIAGLFVVFTFIVKPKAVVQAGTPKPLASAQQTAQPTVAQTAITTAPALIAALGGAYGAIWGNNAADAP